MNANFAINTVLPTQCIVFFALELDCSVPILDALYRNIAWSPYNIVGQLIADLRSEIGQEQSKNPPLWNLKHGAILIEEATFMIWVLPAPSPSDPPVGKSSMFFLDSGVSGITFLLICRTFLRHRTSKASFDRVLQVLDDNSERCKELLRLPLGLADPRLLEYLC